MVTTLERVRSLLLIALLVTLAACGGGNSRDATPDPDPHPDPDPAPTVSLFVDELESNDTAATANALPMGGAGAGDVDTAGDMDYWSFEGTAGEYISVELFAIRYDQAGWASVPNLPALSLFDTDGLTLLVRHEYTADLTGSGWMLYGDSQEDFDIPIFQVPATGTYYLRVEQDVVGMDGAPYGLRISPRDLGTVQTEIEAIGASGGNDTAANAEVLMPGYLQGWHVDNGLDWYKFDVVAPTIIFFELTLNRNGAYRGDDYVDPALRLFDTDGTTELRERDDSYYYDPAMSYQFTTSGTYYICVEESGGSGDAPYYLRFDANQVTPVAEVEPNDDSTGAQALAYGDVVSANKGVDEDWYSFVGKAGDVVWLWMYDTDNLQDGGVTVEPEFLAPDGTTLLPADGEGKDLDVWSTILLADGTYYFRFVSPVSVVQRPYSFKLQRWRGTALEVEGNDTPATANPLDAHGRAVGVIATDPDVDLYSFTAVKDEVVTFHVVANNAVGQQEIAEMGSNADIRIRVLDSASLPLAEAQTDYPPQQDIEAHGIMGNIYTVELIFRAPADGTYYVEISEEQGFSGPLDHYYWLERR